MVKMKSCVALGLTTSLFSLSALAGNDVNLKQTKIKSSDDQTEAGRLHIQLSNFTNDVCQLTNQYVSHGKADTAPPKSIMPGDSKSFDMYQVFMGPDILLDYRCGESTISFEVQQDYAYFIGHTPVVTVQSANGLRLDYDVTAASVFWDNAGMANISILSN